MRFFLAFLAGCGAVCVTAFLLLQVAGRIDAALIIPLSDLATLLVGSLSGVGIGYASALAGWIAVGQVVEGELRSGPYLVVMALGGLGFATLAYGMILVLGLGSAFAWEGLGAAFGPLIAFWIAGLRLLRRNRTHAIPGAE